MPKSREKIHSTAIISPDAFIDENVEIGPHSIVGSGVRIGKNTRIMNNVAIENGTIVGQRCQIYPGVTLGMPAQVRDLKPIRSQVVLGNDNVLRENVTVHAAMKEGAKTIIGDSNYLMVNAHVGHDCVLGNQIILSNNVALGGHSVIEDGSVLGGFVGVHQFVRIGKFAMLGGLSKVTMDVVPFSIYDGHPATFRGVNIIGLRRAGFSSSQRLDIKKALKKILNGRVNFSKAIPEVEAEFAGSAEVLSIIQFIRNSKRGIGRALLEEVSAEDDI